MAGKRVFIFFSSSTWRRLALLCAIAAAPPATALTLQEAEALAMRADPLLEAATARSLALREDAVADGQLPDPKLTMGLFNVPLDSFDLDEHPTTQLRFGVHQSIPPGRTLHFRRRQAEWQAAAQQSRAAEAGRRVLREVRETFLDLYYQVEAGRIIKETRSLFAQMLNITRAHYGAGKANQQDVLRAQLELSRLEDRATEIRNGEDRGRASLSGWIGAAATQPLARTFPELPPLPAERDMVAGLARHPGVEAESARVGASRQAVQVAREQYKPGLNVGIEYRKRFGNEPDDSEREDMMAAMLTMDLPLFREKRQDRRLAASQLQARAATFSRDDRLRELREMLNREYANWLRLGDRQKLYETRLLQEAEANARASIKAYQSGVVEFTTLMRARITELDVRLQDLRVRVDRAKARARLLYLASGEER